ncbi:MAG: AAA family ATPase [Rhizonema sp. NSF051]|nr:AAA family ATPase [Rhizonema sp. NSF051]
MDRTLVSIPGYQVSQEIYNSSKTIVYRGYRETDQKPVILKLLKNPYPSFSQLVEFRNQYTIAKKLNSPLIIQTYSLEPYKNGYMIVMEDFGGIPLSQWKGTGGTVATLIEFCQIAIALCNSLDFLYRHRIIHKDIKPANILINSETKQTKLIDFSIASLLPRETQTIINSNVLEGTLCYLSPEQTGRMNRGIDYRTDFYSLGVTFYELLTRELPFQSKEPMELIHSHIAKLPPLVHEINPQIPPIFSLIVSTLMAKNAEERYQSALGLKYDLENCLKQLKRTGKITDFQIAQRDVCDRFIIPDQLYGREKEVETLFTAFERVSAGSTEMMLIAGFSGIGKTAIVNEVHKPIVRQRGYFIKGKFDQFNRNIPLSAFVSALQDLMNQLLSESDRQIEQWKTQILSALGENGQVIIEVIPQLEQIIGSQPDVPELSGNAVQNRFNFLFQKFIATFTTIEHPLVIFLDDVHWADSASLKLMQLLISKTAPGYLLLIGAYRDHEVFPIHPLILTLNEIEKTGAILNTMTLAPLNQSNINQLIADTLSCSPDLALALTKLVYQKTQGNPFFNNQFLKVLHEEGLITFNLEVGHWECDIAQVNALALTDDVVEFMAIQLQKLPQATQDILKLAACIGNSFDLGTLAIVNQKSQVETGNDLWQALQAGLILPQNKIYKFFQTCENDAIVNLENNSSFQVPTYRFLHDRVQQAAYSMIPDEQKQSTHLKIGRLLLSHTLERGWEENIFEIVNHFNIGRSLIILPLEREQLVKFNLTAARKAKAATAYGAAVQYLEIGIELLPEDSWYSEHDLTRILFEEAATAAYLSTNYPQMEQLAALILQHTNSLLEKIRVYEIKMLGAKAQSQLPEVIQIGLQVLQLLGVEFPAPLTPTDIEQGLQQTQMAVQEYSIPSLLDLGVITDPIQLAVMRILTQMVPSAYQAAPLLMPLLVFKQINLCIVHGNCAVSAISYSDYGLLLCASGEIDTGYEFGQLALNILERLKADALKCRLYFIVYTFLSHWKKPVRNLLRRFIEAYQVGLEMGDLESSALNIQIYCCHAYFAGIELNTLASDMENYRQAISQLKQEPTLHFHEIYQQTVLNLLGRSQDPCQLVGDVYDETQLLPFHLQTSNHNALFYLYYNKTVLCYLLEQYHQAADYADLANSYKDSVKAMFVGTLFHFYSSLVCLALCKSATETQQSQYLEKVVANQEKCKKWSNHSPTNHLHKFYLVEAERHRVLGNKAEAIEYYERAICGAKENSFIHEEALANELAAKFYLEWGKEKIAQSYMTEAYYAYSCWGTKAKVDDLEQRYPQLLASILQQRQESLNLTETIFAASSHTSQTSVLSNSYISKTLDLASIFKASQTLASEIELEKLLSTLLQVVLENAGADKCVLLLPKDEQLVIKAIAQLVQPPTVLSSIATQLSQYVPTSLINFVKRTLKPSVIFNAVDHDLVALDPYILRQHPKSVLCTPILNQGKLIGILYLENNLMSGVFTSDRLEVLNFLCAQAAISLENARVYQQAQNYAKQLELSLEALSASETRFQMFADNLPGVIFQLGSTEDGSLSIHYINSGCYDLYEVTALELMSGARSLRSLEHPDDIPEINRAWLYSIQNLTPFREEWRIITLSSKVKWIQVAALPEQQDDGAVVWNGVILDISDRKHAEAERRKKAEELERASKELQQAQIQLIQNEKMSALGNLVAGVAHEISNPVSFLSGNIQPALDYIEDLFGLVDLYQQKYPNPEAEIKKKIHTIGLDYIREDFPKLVGSMLEGINRIYDISSTLRTFSRKDSDRPVATNIHDGIDSTILILRHRLKASGNHPEIQVIKEYALLPPVECFAGQLNQVFMNLLANAIDALEESNTGRCFADIQADPNYITITTKISDDKQQILISIKDNGRGMTEEVQQKIFDELFTTKTVRKGTGLGLAIAQKIIVEKHKGNIDVNSKIGQGTQFTITIPISHSNS